MIGEGITDLGSVLEHPDRLTPHSRLYAHFAFQRQGAALTERFAGINAELREGHPLGFTCFRNLYPEADRHPGIIILEHGFQTLVSHGCKRANRGSSPHHHRCVIQIPRITFTDGAPRLHCVVHGWTILSKRTMGIRSSPEKLADRPANARPFAHGKIPPGRRKLRLDRARSRVAPHPPLAPGSSYRFVCLIQGCSRACCSWLWFHIREQPRGVNDDEIRQNTASEDAGRRETGGFDAVFEVTWRA